MKRTFYHGTSADNLNDIIKNGLRRDTDKLWNCSSDVIYLWGVKEVSISDDIESENKECKEQAAFRYANESGQLACSTAKDCRIVVLKIIIDDKDIEPDYSCQNMEGRGAVCIDRDIAPSEIKEIHVSNDLSLIKGYFIYLLSENDFNGIEFDRMQLKIASAFSKAELYPEDIDEMIEFEVLKGTKTLISAD